MSKGSKPKAVVVDRSSGANVHRGQSALDSTTGRLGADNGGVTKTPSLDKIMSSRKWPVPQGDTTTGADIKRKGRW